MAKHHLTMRQLVQIRFLIGILLASLVQVSPAVESYTPTYADPVMEPWRWQVYDDPDFRDAECLFKASDGALWIGAVEGVTRYDGTIKTHFGRDRGIQRDNPNSFLETAEGTLYYSTVKTVYSFKDGDWEPLYICNSNKPFFIQFIEEGCNGEFWIGLNIGLLQLKNGIKTLWISSVELNLNALKGDFDRACVIGSNQLIDLAQIPDDANNSINLGKAACFKTFSRSKDRSIWFLTKKGSLYRLEDVPRQKDAPLHWDIYQDDLAVVPPTRIKQILETSDGSLWGIGNNIAHPIVRFDRTLNKWKSLREEISFSISTLQYAITQSSNGTIWICGENSLLMYKNGTWKQFKGRDLPFSESNITHLSATADHSLWLTFRKKGIARLDVSTDRWLTYQGLHFQAEGADGSQWFISVDDRVVHKQADQWRAFGEHDGLIKSPEAIFVTRGGIVWATGRHTGEAAVSWFMNGQWHKKVCGSIAFDMSLYSPLEDKDGTLWFGSGHQVSGKSHSGGVLQCKPAADGTMSFSIFPNPPDDRYRVEGIARDVDGTIFAGGQLKRLKQGKLENYREESMPPRMIYLLQEQQKLWMLTGRFDLLLKERAKRTLFKSSDSSLDRNIYSFLSWNNKTLWAGTDRGIYYFDGSTWTQQSLHKSLAQSSNIYGLRSNKEHTLWINLGRKDSFVRASELFRSVRYQKGNNVPETRIVQSPFNGRHYQADALSLDWDGSDLWRQTPTEELHYSYRFNDAPWSPFSDETQRVFTDLPTGKHRFEVRARNRDLNIDPTPASVSFTIMGPLWLRPWFILMVSLFVSTIIVLLIRLVRSHELRVTEQFKFEKEQAEQHQKLDRFRLEFFTNISHELRTPLTLILGPLEKLSQLAHTTEMQEQGELAKRNANRLLRLVNQLLDMRKLHEGKFKLEVTLGNISQFIENLTASFKLLTDQQSVSIEIDDPEGPLMVQFDPDKLEKIITNLLSNAIKFTPRDGTILLRLKTKEDALHICIEDSGPGIDPAYQHHIFERFAQAPSSSSDKRGTGIGLALTRELVELHGGTIDVESPISPDTATGSRFTIQLPIRQHSSDEICIEPETEMDLADPEPEESHKLTTDSQERPRILVIEDNPDMRRFISMELETNYAILEAEDGEQGVNMALEQIPDLIVSDVMMPKMDGFKVCAILKENLLTSHIPIILLTARGSMDAQVEGFQTGADDYMTKPFNSKLLNIRVRNLLDLRKKLQQLFQKQIDVKSIEVTPSSKDAEFLDKLIQIIDEHIDDLNFNAETFAQMAAVSQSGLYRKIKSMTGQSINVFIRSIRLKRAAQMLAEEGEGIGDISFRVGFSSHHYFTRCFTKEFEISPSKYIESLKN